MLIGYKRYSGPIGVSTEETATRSLWLEKRLALKALLERRGHQVVFLSPPTPPSRGLYPYPPVEQKFDVLFIEHGGTNYLFNKKEIDKTIALIKNHTGRIVHINDDPILVPPLAGRGEERGAFGQLVDARWSIWLNAKVDKLDFHKALHLDPSIPVLDFPVASMLTEGATYSETKIPRLIYLGNCQDSRWKVLKQVVDAGIPLDIAATTSVDEGLTGGNIIDPPGQSQRRAFYSQYLGCLAITDKKHKKWQWRTGRAYHSLMAGIPSLVEAEHEALIEDGFTPFSSIEELQARIQKLMNPDARKAIWEWNYGIVRDHYSLIETAMKASGL
jgi:hypothetical protein